MPHRRITAEIGLREAEQAHRRAKPPAMHTVSRFAVVMLQMHEAAGRLDQSFEVVGVLRFRLEPQVLEDVMCFVVALLVPATEKAAIARMLRDLARGGFGRGALQLRDEA